MNQNKLAGRMILKDLQLFNQATVLFEQELEPEVLDNFSDAIQRWANEHGWISKIKRKGVIGNWIAPPEWGLKNEKGGDGAKYWYEIATVGESQNYLLADLCGVTSTNVGLRFSMSENTFAFAYKSSKCRKDSLQVAAVKFANVLKPLGFIYDGKDFYLPLKLDHAKL